MRTSSSESPGRASSSSPTDNGRDSVYGRGLPISSSTAPRILMGTTLPYWDTAAMTRSDFPVHWPVLTRWTDNDMFGHLNNAVYYELFDTAINAWINTSCGIDPLTVPWLGVVAESGCKYFAELKFPEPLTVGLALARLGNSSVTYRLAIFGEADAA